MRSVHANHFKEACIFVPVHGHRGVLPDDVSYATALQASTCMVSWALGASIHASVTKTAGFLDSDGVASSLITMYSKCGRLGDALQQFEIAEDRFCVMS